MARGPEAGLAIADSISGRHALDGYPYLAAVRGYLLARLGLAAEAGQEFERAAASTGNAAERALFLRQAASARAADPDNVS